MTVALEKNSNEIVHGSALRALGKEHIQANDYVCPDDAFYNWQLDTSLQHLEKINGIWQGYVAFIDIDAPNQAHQSRSPFHYWRMINARR